MSRLIVLGLLYGGVAVSVWMASDALFGAPRLALSLRYLDVFICGAGGWISGAMHYRRGVKA